MVRWDTVQSVVYERTDAYYDLHVPGEEHYLADGLVSHNTGKSRAVLEKLDAYCEKYPGIRVLICRKVRATLAESVLVTWEEHVLTKGHKAIIGTASPHNRKTYEYPNGSHVVLAGMDEPAKIMSTEYDIIAFFEASDSHRTDIERLLSRLRNHRIPHPEGMYPDGKIEDGRTLREALVDGHFLQWGNKCPDGSPLFLEQLICDTNPADAYHHLHLRAKAGKMRWLKSWHEDNPTVTPEFMANLDSLTGVDYRRLRLGEWITAAGLVYDNWNPEIHLIKKDEIPECDWYFAAMDFGYRPSPGAAGVIGVKGKAEGQKLYVVEEEYRLGKLDDWWAGRIGEWKEKYDLVTVVCDSAEPDRIAKLNQYLNRHTRTTGNIAIGANKSIRTGIQAVRYYLSPDDFEVMRWEKLGRQGEKPELGGPRLRVCEQTTDVFVDEELVSEGRPTCLEHEVTAYRYPELEEGKVVKDLPDPTCTDHAMDWLRYGCLWAYRKNFNREPEDRFEPGTLGDIHGHQELVDLQKQEERRARGARMRVKRRKRRGR